MKRVLALVVWVISVALFSACSEDSPIVIPPEEEEDFAFEFLVEDVHGNPVEGIQLTLFNDHDYMQGNAGSRAMIRIPFSLESRIETLVYIKDVEGDTVKTVAHGMLPAGQHENTWNGRNEAGIHLNSGRYEVHLHLFSDEGATVYADSMGILLSQPDSDFFIGTSDVDGRIVIDDKRHFPQLYGFSDMYSVDESRVLRGMFNVTSTMHAFFKDPASGQPTMRTVVDIGPETTQLTHIWDPDKAMERSPQINISEKPVLLDLPANSLGHPYPNPFN